MKTLLREIRAHFTEPRCVYCRIRRDRATGWCRGRQVTAMWHYFPDGSISGRPDYEWARVLADAPDGDD